VTPVADATSFAQVAIGVADIEQALRLWVETFGLEIVAEHEGSDESLERIWNLEEGAIRKQALVGTPGVTVGRVHLVEFSEPEPPVREGAAPIDRCPKNVDLLSLDLPTRVEELAAAGREFRSAWGEYEVDGLTVREVQMPAHDEINVVLLELLGIEIPATDKGYAGLTTFVTVVPDPDAEQAFYTDVVEHPFLERHLLRGEKIEQMVGLPPGAGLDVRLHGVPGFWLGRMELVHYEGVVGEDLFPKARPPALGSLHPTFLVPDLDAVIGRARRASISVRELGEVETIFVRGVGAELMTPSGMRVEVYEPR